MKEKPAVGDLGFYREPGSSTMELCIVTGHGPGNTVDIHIFGTSHTAVRLGHLYPFTLTDDGNIPIPT